MLKIMSFPIRKISPEKIPKYLKEIPQPPTQLTYRGTLPPSDLVLLAVVGSRKYSTYGRQALEHLLAGLAGYEVGIVSGLALGIDSLAHEAALQHNLYTMAIPGSGLDDSVIYPARHKALARRIIESGGSLLSEFDPYFTATKWSFAQRNRIMAGITHATLMIEATEKSGTLITARMAVDYNRELLVVPGNIFSLQAAGPHQFLKLGATPVTHAHDILHALSIDPDRKPASASLFSVDTQYTEEETKILSLLAEPTEKDTLIRKSELPLQTVNALLMQMEMKGYITCIHNIYMKRE